MKSSISMIRRSRSNWCIIRITKERNALISQRAKEMNLEHLIIETKKRRNKAPSNKTLPKGPTTAKIVTTSTTSSSFSTSNDHIPIAIEPVTKKRNIKKRKQLHSSDEEDDSSSS